MELTFGTVFAVVLGLLIAYRVSTIVVRIWRAWGRLELEREQERWHRLKQLRKASPEVRVTPKAAGLRSDVRRLG